MKKINEKRCWDLYNLLMTAPDKWWSQDEVVNWVDGYDYYPHRPEGTDKAPEIREDVLVLNGNTEIDKIIVVNRYKYKIANKEEAVIYMKKRVNRLRSQVEQINNLRFKMLRDGHKDILADKWWETYINEK